MQKPIHILINNDVVKISKLCIIQFSQWCLNRLNTCKISDVPRYPLLADYKNLDYFRSRISVLSDGSLLAGAL